MLFILEQNYIFVFLNGASTEMREQRNCSIRLSSRINSSLIFSNGFISSSRNGIGFPSLCLFRMQRTLLI